MSMALSMAGAASQPPSRAKSFTSTRTTIGRSSSIREFGVTREFSLYKGISERPMGWKKTSRAPELGTTAGEFGIKKFDGKARLSTDWDGLRKVRYSSASPNLTNVDLF